MLKAQRASLGDLLTCCCGCCFPFCHLGRDEPGLVLWCWDQQPGQKGAWREGQEEIASVSKSFLSLILLQGPVLKVLIVNLNSRFLSLDGRT